jgi:hypothetical protein
MDGAREIGTVYERNHQFEGYFLMQKDAAVFGDDMDAVADEMIRLARVGRRRSLDRRPAPEIW